MGMLKNQIEKNQLTATYISISLIAVSMFVILGWVLNIRYLTSVHHEWVTMKFSTAFNFLLCGLAVLFRKNHKAELYVYGMVGSVTISTVINYFFGVSSSGFFPVLENGESTLSLINDFPSWATLLCFGMISAYPFLRRDHKTIFPAAVIAIATVAIIGYTINQPILYYYHPEKSTAMAFHTAILLGHMGTYQYYNRKRKRI